MIRSAAASSVAAAQRRRLPSHFGRPVRALPLQGRRLGEEPSSTPDFESVSGDTDVWDLETIRKAYAGVRAPPMRTLAGEDAGGAAKRGSAVRLVPTRHKRRDDLLVDADKHRLGAYVEAGNVSGLWAHLDHLRGVGREVGDFHYAALLQATLRTLRRQPDGRSPPEARGPALATAARVRTEVAAFKLRTGMAYWCALVSVHAAMARRTDAVQVVRDAVAAGAHFRTRHLNLVLEHSTTMEVSVALFNQMVLHSDALPDEATFPHLRRLCKTREVCSQNAKEVSKRD
eukprot:Rhum_TRINITY_DN12865_c0_g2::Rhum_TRINITY_DN12865_c0_g2_i1::g.54971::m.54971